ncbi:hypothetical protein NL393_39325, partial [Klebsiella pneumoniae]|nr:hypothetical protein [Klebsiella pneumoniae]
VPTPTVVPLYQTTPSSSPSTAQATSPAATWLTNNLLVGVQQLRYGRHNTVSANGETLIESFRQSLTGTAAQQAQAWADV